MTANVAIEQAKADRMPRYEQPVNEEHHDENGSVCEDCNCWLRLKDGDAKTILGQINRYSRMYKNEREKRVVAKAVTRCGICALLSEIRASTEPVCEEHFSPIE